MNKCATIIKLTKMVGKGFIETGVHIGNWATHRPPIGKSNISGTTRPISTEFCARGYPNIPIIRCENNLLNI